MKRLTLVGVPALVVVLALVSARAAAGPRASFVDPTPTMKIQVDKDGWYRVSKSTLEGNGFVFPANVSLLHLTTGGQEVSFELRNGTLEFYGQALDTLSTDTRTYWLSLGATPGVPVNFARARAAATAPSSTFESRVVVKDRKYYYQDIINGPANNIFGDINEAITPSTPVSRTLNVPSVAGTQSASTTLRVDLQGSTATSHAINVALNNQNLGQLTGSGQQQMSATFPVSGILTSGANTVTFTDVGPSNDGVLTDTYTVVYQHSATADSNTARRAATAGQPFSIDGFSTKNVRLVDLNDPLHPTELLPSIRQVGGTFTISVTPPTTSSQLYAFEDSTALSAKAVVKDVASTLQTPGRQADLVVISHKDFLASVQPLVTKRQAEGLSVVVTDVEDVYDEFNFGNKDPQAIKSFLQYAKNNWQVKPRYVLFVGDASSDPRNFIGAGSFDFVPTNMVDATYSEAPSDDSLADFTVPGDGIPELSVGRLAVRTASEAANQVAKIVDYANTAPVRPRTAVLVADNFDRGDYRFDQFSDDLQANSFSYSPPNDVSVTKIYRPNGATPASDTTTHNQIIAAASNNPTIVNWFGHGSIRTWNGSPPLLKFADGATLTNTALRSLYLMMTCENGYFVDPTFGSLAESLMSATNGAVAVWASSGQTTPSGQIVAAKVATNELITDPTKRLGDAMVDAKAAVPTTTFDYLDVRHTWVLLGDPSTKLN